MVNRFSYLLVPAIVLGSVMTVSCRKNKSAAPEAKQEITAASEVEGGKTEANGFTDTAMDGRAQIFATYKGIANVDFTKVHPSTASFYGISAVTDLVMTQDPTHTQILFQFSNIQEAVPKAVMLAGAKRMCSEEGFANLKVCLEEAIKRSGAIVFQPKVKLTKTIDPNDPNLLYDVLENMIGVTAVSIQSSPAEDGYMLSCSACHSSARSLTSYTGIKKLTIDLRGDNTFADVKKVVDPVDYMQRGKNVINNPADPIWAISNRTKAAGLLAAQYLKLQQTEGHKYAATDSHITTHLKDASISRYVNIGWVFAMLSASTSARNACNFEDFGDGTGDPRCLDPLTDQLVAKRTERASLNHFMEGGSRYAITQAFLSKGDFSLIPDRPMRSLLPINATQYEGVDNPTFTLEYMEFSIYGQANNRNEINQRYLLGATAGAAIMPNTYDLNLSKAWLGSAATSSSATAFVNANLPRVVLTNYAADSLSYHQARFSQTTAVAKEFAPSMTMDELLQTTHYAIQTCYTCHNLSTVYFYSSHWTSCASGAECEVKTVQWAGDSNNTSEMGYDSPTSLFAGTVFKEINSSPEALSGLDYAMANRYVKIKPKRLPLLNRHALLDWSFPSFADALSATPPPAQYGVVSPIVSYNGVTQFRTQSLNFSLGFTGPGVQELRCLETATFDLNNDGIKESSCVDTLKVVSGYTPRLIGKSDLIARHQGVDRPTAHGTTADAMNRMLHALDVGIVKVTDAGITKYFRFKFDDTLTINKYDYDYDYYWSNGGDDSSGYTDDSSGGYDGGGY